MKIITNAYFKAQRGYVNLPSTMDRHLILVDLERISPKYLRCFLLGAYIMGSCKDTPQKLCGFSLGGGVTGYFLSSFPICIFHSEYILFFL